MASDPGRNNTVERSRLLVVAGLIWLAKQQILVQERPGHARHGAGALEFPGGKVEIGEDPRSALLRELREECGERAANWQIGPIADVLHHIYPPPGPEIVLLLYHVDARSCGHDLSCLCPLPGARLEAVAVDQLPPSRFLAADEPLVLRLRRGDLTSPFAS